ncbi:hypothetical protein [Streptomyces huasconensis]|uniref:hypothetical protein n=1 Tax=Streptomyces huasconensis TaxID=1854574 RepID=UPI0037035629
MLPTLLVGGQVARVWRPVDDGIKAMAFHPLSSATWDGLAAEARSLRGLLASRGTKVHSRHHHCWATLPEAEIRLLA